MVVEYLELDHREKLNPKLYCLTQAQPTDVTKFSKAEIGKIPGLAKVYPSQIETHIATLVDEVGPLIGGEVLRHNLTTFVPDHRNGPVIFDGFDVMLAGMTLLLATL